MTIGSILKSLGINRIYFSRSAVCAMFQCYLKHFLSLFETPKTTHFLQNLNIFCTKNQCFWWKFVVKSKDFHDFLEIPPTLRGSFSMTTGPILYFLHFYYLHHESCRLRYVLSRPEKTQPSTRVDEKCVFPDFGIPHPRYGR